MHLLRIRVELRNLLLSTKMGVSMLENGLAQQEMAMVPSKQPTKRYIKVIYDIGICAHSF